ncbi:Angiotensin-converting enzyme [Aquisphaera giovannonii]|uniref:Angiotensin-converting enzyme n=1 Tax=Aquisphaera giovannonii TaxID=406548 RepID=A0A5B9WEQ0_9BACT|nr:M2 family metallopeptidase [Aquisphaera giovannonii]QEH39128.1 Angiotensin-converting enzyme [Aquisphaera giovannonii]
MTQAEGRGVDRREFLRAGMAAAAAVAASPGAAMAARPPIQEVAEAILEEYVRDVLPLMVASNEASWAASTDVSEAHSAAQAEAMQRLYEKAGARRVIEETARLLGQKDQLDDLTVRQLEKVRLAAAESPGTLPDVVKARTEAEAKQSAAQDGFAYTLRRDGKPDEHPTANDIDRVLVNSKDLGERLAYWEVSKSIGAPLRPGILKLRDLRNQLARAMGFDDFFALQVADYGMTTAEMVALCDRLAAEVRPLYEQLHTWAKHALAKRYGVDAPAGKIPAHWLPNRWGQNWPSLVEGVDMDAPFKGKPKEYIAEQAERFYASLGFPKLPQSFWRKSDLYPADPKSGRKKNSHASAWHIDLREDVRSLMSIEPDNRWFTTAHHELGHIYYYISYSRPEVPYLLRAGANRAFHEGIGDLIGLAAGQRPYLKSVGLLTPEAEKAPAITFLLDTALDGSSAVFLPFAAGTMTHFERDFYAGKIGDEKLNEGWWRHVGHFQGIAPPGDRPEALCDAATKTHINDDPAQYYDYAIGTVIKFQLHDHIAREILRQDPRECNYFGDEKVGDFLRGILRLGATRDWNAVLREATGEGLTARPLVAYFEPLMEWLRKENAGREVGWS